MSEKVRIIKGKIVRVIKGRKGCLVDIPPRSSLL